MSALESTKTAIHKLSVEKRAEIVAELCGWTDDDWDRQMRAAAAAGKFDTPNREADIAQAHGATRPLETILRK